MSWLTTIGVALVTAFTGGACAGVLTYFIVAWFGLRRHDGGDLGYYIVFIPVGILCGLVVGVVVSRLRPASGGLMTLGVSLALLLVAAGAVAVGAHMFGDTAPAMTSEQEANQLVLQVELKYPPGWVPDGAAVKRTETMKCELLPLEGPDYKPGKPTPGTVSWRNAKMVEGRWVVPCDVILKGSPKARLVSLTIGKTWVEFNAELPPIVTADADWSEWTTDGFSQPALANCAYRRRIRTLADIHDADAAAKRAVWEARDQAAAAIGPHDPIEKWLPLFEDPDGSPSAWRWGGAERMERKAVAARVMDLKPLLESKDQAVVRGAVCVLGALDTAPADLAEPLVGAGRVELDLIAAAARASETDREMAEKQAIRFWGMWKVAAKNTGGGKYSERFRPILQQIEAAARQSGLKDDVAIVARESKEALDSIGQ